MTDLYRQLRDLSHQRYKAIWEAVNAGAELEGDEKALGEAMNEHPEYHQFWGKADQYVEREALVEGVNPFMHVLFHSIIENQVASKNPPEVAEALIQLQARGISRHEALHRLGSALAEEVWHVLKENRPYNNERYVKAIKRAARSR